VIVGLADDVAQEVRVGLRRARLQSVVCKILPGDCEVQMYFPRCAASQGCNVPFGTKGINANELIRLLCGLRILREQVGDIVVVVGLSSHGDRVVL
jgi:hypothetical protein